ncbi:hypothetical protein J4558_10005 [Leptolyngbya sp. 15MV]|nr:hypothetical protein J4558_10005 [Leptolyngbya sp. 15MV]
MTVYRAAAGHVRLLLAVTALGVVLTIAYERQFGHSVIPFIATSLVLIALNRRISRFNCPRCGSNLFLRKGWAWPWPNKVCSECGLDLEKS